MYTKEDNICFVETDIAYEKKVCNKYSCKYIENKQKCYLQFNTKNYHWFHVAKSAWFSPFLSSAVRTI